MNINESSWHYQLGDHGMNIFYWFGFVWIICGVASYLVGMKACKAGYSDHFNRETHIDDRKFCLRMALFGPINLLVVIIFYFRKRQNL